MDALEWSDSSDSENVSTTSESESNDENEDMPVAVRDESYFRTVEFSYEVDVCVKWIKKNNFFRVAVQFPVSLEEDAQGVCLVLASLTNKRICAIRNMPYGSCCVNEIAAERERASAVIHFGHACLSPIVRLPVLYVLGMKPIDISDAVLRFKQIFVKRSCHVIIYYELFYFHAIDEIEEKLKYDYRNLIISRLDIPTSEQKKVRAKVKTNEVKITKCQRSFMIPKTKKLEDYFIFYIGCDNRTLVNVMLSLSNKSVYGYNPATNVVHLEKMDLKEHLLKSFFTVEKIRNASTIGIVVDMAAVDDYVQWVKFTRTLLKLAGKKSYTLTLGKTNISRFAHSGKIDLFVGIPYEKSVVNCSGFHQPVVTVSELNIALNTFGLEMPRNTP